MDEMTVTEARENLSKAVSRIAFSGERIVLTRSGKRAAALVSVEDLELLEYLEDKADVEEATAILERMEASGEQPIPWEQVKAKAGL